MERRYFPRRDTRIEVSVYEGASWLGRATVGNVSVEGLRLQWGAPDNRRHSILEVEVLPQDSSREPARVPVMVLWQGSLAAGGVFAEAGCFERLLDALRLPEMYGGEKACSTIQTWRLMHRIVRAV